MKLTYFRHTPSNFGDELNAIMWHELLPEGFLDEDEGELFLGIGSILWDHLPRAPMKHVMGSGFGGYTAPPDVHDGSWNVVWLRGPVTAERLGVDPGLAICDSAILLRAMALPPPVAGAGTVFMPHFESATRGDWERACALAGIGYLDPRDDVLDLLARIRGAKLMITEAMHGAIVADALRVPWIGIVPFFPQHRAKWEDWAGSLGFGLRPAVLPPSNLLEAYTLVTGQPGKGRRSRALFKAWPAAPVNAALVHRAAARLRRLTERVEPQLSPDAAIARATERSLEALDAFVRTRTSSPQAFGRQERR
ncbi:polysaccharide pyruvyl transferase family protein [Tabrizicola sp.]|uniref:polysaccharide pyruvyl transferase family protein n=1 Tax=Tabrizicola sp. TaxID=2005166 RepID=UPI003F386D5C